MEIEKYIVATDQQLVDMALLGDNIAFEQLFNRYRNSIYQLYSQRMESLSDETNDLLQEVFIKVYLNLSRYNSSYTFGQWVYTIARNTFIDYTRRHRDELSVNSSIVESVVGSDHTPSPEERMIVRQSKHKIEHLMSQMPERYSKLIELRFLEEHSYEEIAIELSLPMGTVKTQIHRARAMLCKMLSGDEDF